MSSTESDSDIVVIGGKQISQMKVTDLKEELGKLGLSKVGVKKDLVQRLSEALAQREPGETKNQIDNEKAEKSQVETSDFGNEIVAKYREEQMRTLSEAKKEADAMRAAEMAKDQNPPEPDDDQKGPDIEEPAVAPGPGPASIHPEDPTPNETPENLAKKQKPEEKESSSSSGQKDEEDDKQKQGVEAEPDLDLGVELPADAEDNSAEDFQRNPPDSPKADEKESKFTGVERKKKWAASKVGKRTAMPISSESLEDMIQDIEGDGNKFEPDYDEQEPQQQTTADKPKRIVISADNKEEQEDLDQAPGILPGNRLIMSRDEPEEKDEPDLGPVDEYGLRHSRPPEEPRHGKNQFIMIRGLVRPLHIKHLSELLENFGSFDKDEFFWINNVKSTCIVRFETDDQAMKAQKSLNFAIWPDHNTEGLRVDFCDLNLFVSKSGKSHLMVEKEHKTEHLDSTKTKKRDHERSTSRTRGRPSIKRRREERDKEPEPRKRVSSPPNERAVKPEREWDIGKDFKRGESPKKEEQRRRRLDLTQPEKPRIRVLDELFRKTQTTPSLYYLPLTDQQIKEKEKETKGERGNDTNEERYRGHGQKEEVPTGVSPPDEKRRRRRSRSPPNRSRR